MAWGGIAQGIVEGLKANQDAVAAGDRHAESQLAQQAYKLDLNQKTAQQVALDKITAAAQALPELNFDMNGNVVNAPLNLQQTNTQQPMLPPGAPTPQRAPLPPQSAPVFQPPQPMMPGQASVPNPMPPNIPPGAMQSAVPPGAVPQVPQSLGPMAAPPPPQPQAIPPYVDTSKLSGAPPMAQPPQAPPGNPPEVRAQLSPEQMVQESVLSNQAKAILMPDQAFQTIFGVKPTETENKIAAYKKLAPGVPVQAILSKLGFTGPNAMKDARAQIGKEREHQEQVQLKMATIYDHAMSRDSKEKYQEESLSLRRDKLNSDRSVGEELTLGGMKLAQEFIRAGKPLPGGWSSKGISRGNAILNDMAAGQSGGSGSGSIVGGQAVYKADTAALGQINKDLTAIRPYKNMLDKNIDIAVDLGRKIVSSDSSRANKTINWLKTNLADSPDTKEYLGQVAFVQTEAARVLNTPRLVGQLTDSARHEMQEIVDGNTPIKSAERVFQRMKMDGENRVEAMEKERQNIIDRMSGKTESGNSQPKLTAEMYAKLPRGATFVDDKGNIRVKQ